MRRFFITGIIIFTFASAAVMKAEEPAPPPDQTVESDTAPGDAPQREFFPRFRGRAVILDIDARIVEQNNTVSWNESHRKTTIPGRPVGIKIVGANVVVAVQVTPYLRRGSVQKFLVAQGQIWMDVPEQGIRYQTSIQTIPLEYEEPIYFFPLGPFREDTANIEVMLTLHPYEEDE